MKRKAPDRDREPLFDLPLDQGSDAATGRAGTAAQPQLPLEAEEEHAPPEPPEDVSDDSGAAPPRPPRGEEPKTLFALRVAAGCVDFALHLAVLGLAVGGSIALGVPAGRLSAFPLILFAAGFSFIYHVLPLVFWGRTPGMALRGLTARGLDAQPLTIGQAVRRWLGAVLNVACLGLPFALLRERSIADRLSGSNVHP